MSEEQERKKRQDEEEGGQISGEQKHLLDKLAEIAARTEPPEDQEKPLEQEKGDEDDQDDKGK